MPVLGICGGQQLLAVALGGTLIQHIPDTIAGRTAARTTQPPSRAGPRGGYRAGNVAAPDRWNGGNAVNSAHHQAVREPGRLAIVNATAYTA